MKKAVDAGTVTVTALPPLPTLDFEEVVLGPSELDGRTVTYAVVDGTVTVTAPAMPWPPSADDAVVLSLDSAVVADELMLAFTVLVALELSPGTAPSTLTTLLSTKQPICTPLVVFSGITAQISPAPQPETYHLPALVQLAYSASMQAYWPSVHSEVEVRLTKAVLSELAWARFEAYTAGETVPDAGGEELTIAVGMLLPLGALEVAMVAEGVSAEEIVVNCATGEVVVDGTPVGLRTWTEEVVFETWETTGGVLEVVGGI